MTDTIDCPIHRTSYSLAEFEEMFFTNTRIKIVFVNPPFDRIELRDMLAARTLSNNLEMALNHGTLGSVRQAILNCLGYNKSKLSWNGHLRSLKWIKFQRTDGSNAPMVTFPSTVQRKQPGCRKDVVRTLAYHIGLLHGGSEPSRLAKTDLGQLAARGELSDEKILDILSWGKNEADEYLRALTASMKKVA